MSYTGFRHIPPELGEEEGFWGRRNARIEDANHVGGDKGPPWQPGVPPTIRVRATRDGYDGRLRRAGDVFDWQPPSGRFGEVTLPSWLTEVAAETPLAAPRPKSWIPGECDIANAGNLSRQ